MPQSLARLLVHLVFSTKNRVPFLQSLHLRSEVHAYLTSTLRGLDCEPVQVGGMADHVHLLFGLARTICFADLVKHLKTSSTKMIRQKGHHGFSWQTGYGAFTKSFPISDLRGWSTTKCEGNLLASRGDRSEDIPGEDHAPKSGKARRSQANAGRSALLLAAPAFLLERPASTGGGERQYRPR